MQPVPQMSRNYLHFQLLDAWHAHYAHAFFLSTFVNVENKGSLNYIPKLKVASSIPAARSIKNREFVSRYYEYFSIWRQSPPMKA